MNSYEHCMLSKTLGKWWTEFQCNNIYLSLVNNAMYGLMLFNPKMDPVINVTWVYWLECLLGWQGCHILCRKNGPITTTDRKWRNCVTSFINFLGGSKWQICIGFGSWIQLFCLVIFALTWCIENCMQLREKEVKNYLSSVTK